MKKNIFIYATAAALLAMSVFAGCSDPAQPSEVLSIPSGPSSSTVSQIPSQTAPSDFDSYFEGNPIDQAHSEALALAMSNADIIKAENQFADLWKKEIESCYDKLLTAAPSGDQGRIEQEQTKWSSESQQRLTEIEENAAQGEGTMAGVQQATQTMNFYRDRAKELYRSLYQYDQTFTYAYQPS